jgi:hypothetical protein
MNMTPQLFAVKEWDAIYKNLDDGKPEYDRWLDK